MASLYCTGPCHAFVGVGAGYAPAYLGTCEDSPNIEIMPAFDDVPNDIAGKRKPLDRQFQGEDAMFFGVFNRYNESVLRAMQARPYRNRARGYQPFGSMGAFMQLEGLYFPLWITFPYVVKPAMVAAGMPVGYRFPICFLEGPDRMPLGTRWRNVSVAIYCERQFSIANGGEFLLYDHNTNGLPAID